MCQPQMSDLTVSFGHQRIFQTAYRRHYYRNSIRPGPAPAPTKPNYYYCLYYCYYSTAYYCHVFHCFSSRLPPETLGTSPWRGLNY